VVHFALAVGGFAIGTTEFATMSLLRYFAHDLRIDEPTAGHVISAYALGVVVGALRRGWPPSRVNCTNRSGIIAI